MLGYLKSLVPPGLPGWLAPIIFFLELITYFFTRPVTLALRLFGNMFAGHLMLARCSSPAASTCCCTAASCIQLAGVLGLGFGFVMTFFELLVAVPAGVHLHPAHRALHRRRGRDEHY